MTFNPVLEGLRALAVTMVVAYHFAPNVLPGGYVGVDVFFVISGFLITSSLLETLHSRPRFWPWVFDFWARRARRLMPNALLVVLVSSIAASIMLSAFSWRRLGGEVSWASLYSINWLFALRATDYLTSDEVHRSVLLHYWSLAVEEQFYLAWPLLLYPMSRWLTPGDDKAKAAWFIAMLALASAAACLWTADSNPSSAFFATHTRGWELLAGAGMAARNQSRQTQAKSHAAWLPLGAGLVVLSAFSFGKDTQHPGLWTIAPVLGTMLAIHGSTQAGWMQRLLSSRVMQALGARSYSVYLWHWPVLVLGTLHHGDHSLGWRLGLLGMSLLLAELAWRCVETPFRFRWYLTARNSRIVASALLASLGLASFGLFLRDGAPVKMRWTSASDTLLLPAPDAVRLDWPEVLRNGCHLSIRETQSPPCVFGQPEGERAVVLFGDSHAAQWFSALDSSTRQAGARLYAWTKSDCPPVEASAWNHRTHSVYRECNEWRKNMLERIETMRPALVILAGLVKKKPDIAAADGQAALAGPEALDAWTGGLQEVITRLQRQGIGVVVIRDVPVPADGALDCLYSADAPDRCTRALAEAESKPALDAAAAKLTGAPLWDFTDALCPRQQCSMYDATSGTVAYRDSNHLTDRRVRELTPFFAERLQTALSKP